MSTASAAAASILVLAKQLALPYVFQSIDTTV